MTSRLSINGAGLRAPQTRGFSSQGSPLLLHASPRLAWCLALGSPGSNAEMSVQEAHWEVPSGRIPVGSEGSRTGQTEMVNCSEVTRKASADATGSSGAGTVLELFHIEARSLGPLSPVIKLSLDMGCLQEGCDLEQRGSLQGSDIEGFRERNSAKSHLLPTPRPWGTE